MPELLKSGQSSFFVCNKIVIILVIKLILTCSHYIGAQNSRQKVIVLLSRNVERGRAYIFVLYL